jgi:hypothetical protein
VTAAARVSIRCDGHEGIGAGHLARCLPLAHELARRGLEPELTGSFDGLAAWLAEHSGLPVRAPHPGAPCGVDLAVAAAIVDGYDFDPAELCALAERVPVGTLAEGRRCHDAGVWVDYHLDRAGEPATERLLPGPAYAPVDPGLAGLARPGDEVRRVLIAVGGGAAARDLVADLAAAVREAFPGCRLLIGSGAEVEGPDVERLPFPAPLRDAVAGADLAVSAAGLTAYELACAGLPAVILQVVDNQRRVAEGCAKAGIALVAGEGHLALREALQRARDPEVRGRLRTAGMATFDGRGAARSVAGLLERWSLQ